jgi:hypothetical protein
MNSTLSRDDPSRTPLAAGLSVLLHGTIAVLLAWYFWTHVTPVPESTQPFEVFDPPPAATDSNNPPAPSSAPNASAVPSLAPLFAQNFTNAPAPTPLAPPKVPTPPKPMAPTAPPAPAVPSHLAKTVPPQKLVDYREFLSEQHMSATAPSPPASARYVPQVGINATSIVNSVRSNGQRSGGAVNGTGTHSTQANNDYLARLVARLQAAFVPPNGLAGLSAGISLTIDANGVVTARVLTQSSGNTVFDAAVQVALDQLTNVDPPPSGRAETYPFIFEPGAQ